ncbi:hypothetical protein KIN20_003190 [Parelaphostrongylus tenuis]|uniref:Uncharacterized protein n=1 Tax=Parelaphostrongylus tenuis TaxID=148309 RepID=A0AAD5MPK1_PARTN|nr:hypothetical protein KIN20_003190 [Parelaphostrongylus tenuis]
MTRSSSLRTIIILMPLIVVSTAIKCYNGVIDKDEKVKRVEDCNDTYCLKLKFQGEQQTVISYTCDQTNMCQKDGCYTGYANSLVCCCSKDYCNSSSNLSTLFAIVAIVLVKIFA